MLEDSSKYLLVLYEELVLRLHFSSQIRHCHKQVLDQTIVCHLKNRGLGVLIDGDNGLGVFHSRNVLDGSRNTYGNVKIGCNDLARLSHLFVVWCHTCIHGGATSSHSGLSGGECVCQSFQYAKLFRRSNATAPRNDNPGCRQIRTTTRRRRHGLRLPCCLGKVLCFKSFRLGGIRDGCLVKRRRSNGHDLTPFCCGLYLGQGIASVEWTNKGFRIDNFHHIRQGTLLQHGGCPWDDRRSPLGGCSHDKIGRIFFGRLLNGIRGGFHDFGICRGVDGLGDPFQTRRGSGGARREQNTIIRGISRGFQPL
mmetsp:Transcript_9659/g.18461  ORF Transcript_9659/g.18461 Transcript_9659/m.18461 type:complete len:309 (-) Transcript_9659:302-1228(-)